MFNKQKYNAMQEQSQWGKVFVWPQTVCSNGGSGMMMVDASARVVQRINGKHCRRKLKDRRVDGMLWKLATSQMV